MSKGPLGPLVVSVADLVHHPGARRHERLRARLPTAAVVGTMVRPEGEVEVDVVLESVSDGIVARGSVTAPWQAVCRRCLGEVRGMARAELRELFEDRPTDGETYPLRHERIDLEPLAREAALLELPLAPLCRAECRGLCPTCGVDLNRGSCECPTAEADPRWAALDDLRQQLET